MDEHIENFVLNWNYSYPVDRWWREKHKVAFNSPAHRISNFWDQLFEYREDVLYVKMSKESKYKPNENNWLKIHEIEEQSLDDSIVNAMNELSRFKEAYGDR
jgi:hypothetical protein